MSRLSCVSVLLVAPNELAIEICDTLLFQVLLGDTCKLEHLSRKIVCYVFREVTGGGNRVIMSTNPFLELAVEPVKTERQLGARL